MTQVERTTVREEVERIEETETFRQCDGCKVDDSEEELRTLHVNPYPVSTVSSPDMRTIAQEIEMAFTGPPMPSPSVVSGERPSREEMVRDKINEKLVSSVEFTSDGEIDLCPDCAYTLFDYKYDGADEHPDDRGVDDDNLRIEWADADGLDVEVTVEKHAWIQIDPSIRAALALVGCGMLIGASLASQATIPMFSLWALLIALVAGMWAPQAYRVISRRVGA